ncbi:MAG: hypothetical protein HOV87_33605 [Catenulispora sp.]|nr:hypothetical protein [Catenulispora sp.]
MSGWRGGTVPHAYAAGYAMQLVVFTNDAPTQVATKYGPACGRPYPLSSRFLSDMTTLAQTFAGQASGPPLYVSMFAEFQTYPCVRGGWSADPTTTAYYEALMDQYQAAEAIFHRYAPNAKVALCWGGWQARSDEPGKGGGRSMFPHLAAVLKTSDFESFQAMQSDTNVNDIRDMTRILGQYGPVLLAYYKPDNRSQATFDADIHTVFTPDYLRGVVADGLFGFAFMDNANLTAEPATAAFLNHTATEFGRTAR